MSILEELKWRGLVADCTDKAELEKKISTPVTLYCGFDPTADSLHVGNLVPLLALRRFQLLGHHPIAVAGGATGSIGDPSGKTQERQLLTREILERNIASVKVQLAKLLDFEIETKSRAAGGQCVLDAKRFAISNSCATSASIFPSTRWSPRKAFAPAWKTAKSASATPSSATCCCRRSISWCLCRDHNCELQIGGSDQWGNITAGIDLCRKKLGKTVYGLTLPLITNADGTKFGKTEAGAVWLDPKRPASISFYQFWINTDDRDVIRYLKFFTFLSQEEIDSLEKQHAENPGARAAHKALAKAVTDLIHGESATAGSHPRERNPIWRQSGRHFGKHFQ